MRRSGGFTLTELIMVIVILAIVSSISVRFIQFSAQGALDVANRQQLSMASSVVSEQISRELRSALPGSVRVDGDNRCVEFIPVVAGSIYEPFELNETVSSFRAVPFDGPTGGASQVVIYPYADSVPDGLYQGGSVSRTGFVGISGADDGYVSVDIAPHSFTEDSPTRRVLLVSEPVTFCQDQGGSAQFLFRYSNYGFNASVGTGLPTSFSASGPSREVVATPLQAGSMEFQFQPPTLQRNGVVTMAFVMQSTRSDESLSLSQEVQIRNVP